MSRFTETSRRIVVGAASEICTVFAHYENAGFDNHPPGLMPHILLSAALVFLQERISSPPLSSSVSSALLAHNLEQCILNLRKMSSAWDLSDQTLHVIWSRASSIGCSDGIGTSPPGAKDALYPNPETIPSLVELMPVPSPPPLTEFGVPPADEESQEPMAIGFTGGGGEGGGGFLGQNSRHMQAGGGCDDANNDCLHLTAAAAASIMEVAPENDACHWMNLKSAAATGDEEILIAGSEVAGLLDDVVGCDSDLGMGTWDGYSMSW